MKKILFIGLSNKEGCEPLESGTKSGDLIDNIINKLNEDCYKINLVNFAPLDDKGKLRYPNKSEMDKGYKNLKVFIENLNPDLCVFLGNIVNKYLSNKITNYIKIKHPSYMAVYKRKYTTNYIDDTVNLIQKQLCNNITNN